jgi:hypothetical protein
MKRNFIFLFFAILPGLLSATTDRIAMAPDQMASNLQATGTDGNKMQVKWTNGNGSRRIVIARKDQPVSAIPQNGTDYAASSTFGLGNELKEGEFVVYNGNSSYANISGLLSSSLYYFAVFEYNGTGASIEFLTTPATISGSTICFPIVQPDNLLAGSVDGHSMQISWTNPSTGAGSGHILLARKGAPVNVNPVDLTNYAANASFGKGARIGVDNFVVYKDNGSQVTVTDLDPGQTYYFSLFEYNGSSGLVFNITNPPQLSASTLERPGQPASAINFSGLEGNAVTLSFTKGNGARRLIIAREGSPVSFVPQDGQSYTGSAAFGSGQEVKTGEYVLSTGTSTSIVVSNLTMNTLYYFTIFEYDGLGTAAAYQTDLFCSGSVNTASAPSIAASNIQFSNISNTSVTISWDNGDGLRRLVVVRKSSELQGLPESLTRYAPSTSYQYGSNVGTNNYAVYSNTGNSVNVTGLQAGETYSAAVFEYNGNNAPVYKDDFFPSASFSTSLAPTIAAKNIQFKNIEGNRLSVSWQNGNGNFRLLVAKAGSPVEGKPSDNVDYTANTSFGSGDVLNEGEFVIANNNVSSVTMTNCQPGLTYHFAIFEYNKIGDNRYYLSSSFATASQSTAAAPTVASSNMIFSKVSGNSLLLSWTKGNGANRIILAREGAPVEASPADFSTYAANSQYGQGTRMTDDSYIVYNGYGNSATVNGLNPGKTYYFTIFEYNGAGYPVYLTSTTASASVKMLDRPSVPSSGMSFSSIEGNKLTIKWTSGNGARRILIGRKGLAVTAVPQDGYSYPANAAFTIGSEIAPDQFVLADNSNADVQVTGLDPASSYYFAVFEYDGEGTDIRYQTDEFLSGSCQTLAPPAGQAANILFSSVSTNSVSMNWTTTSADRYLVIMRKGTPVSAVPENLHAYSASYKFGKVIIEGDHAVVYSNAGSGISVTNLEPGTTYYTTVYAFNGFSAPMYNQNKPAFASVTTTGPPLEPASAIQFVDPGPDQSLQIRWENGSGQKRLVLVKEDGPVDAVPADNINYVANTYFGGGDELGNGNFAVYNGTGDQVIINNIQSGHAYHIAIFEYNDFASGPLYLSANPSRAAFNGFVLPLQLLSFTSNREQQGVVLQWETAMEENTDYFAIERSSDAATFVQIGRVQASGWRNSTKAYDFVDIHPLPAAYYRLRMADHDGRFIFSQVLRVQNKQHAEKDIKIYPTLVQSQINILLPQQSSTAYLRWEIFNIRGQLVQLGSSMPDASGNWHLQVGDLKPGQYILRIANAREHWQERFVKQ